MKRKYSLRKFKGIGLASVVIGFILLSSPVYAESLDGGGGLVNATEAASTNPQPEGNVIARGEDGVPWELYENGYLLFKPVAGKDTLTNNGDTSWKVNHGAKIKHIGFAGKVYAPNNSGYLFAQGYYHSDRSFNPITIDMTHFDTSRVTSMYHMFFDLSNLIKLDVSHFDTSKVTDMRSMFQNVSNLTELDVTNFNTSKVTYMDNMFASMHKLTNLNVTNFDTSQVTNMEAMFYDMSNLASLDVTHFDTHNVTNMESMFADMLKLTNLDVTHFDTSQVTDMSSMFYGMSKLTNLDVTKFNTSNVIDMGWMFYDMSNLANLDVTSFDTSKVTNMYGMFSGMSNLTNLDVTHFNTGKVINMTRMFYGASHLINLDVTKFNTSKVTSMYAMFSGMSNLTHLDVTKFDTSKVIYMTDMFSGMSKLTNLDLSSFNTHEATDINRMFQGTHKLKELKLGNKFKADGIRTIPVNHNYGDQYTDKWHKVNDKAHPYTVSNWANLYNSNPTTTAGTWVREEKAQDATLTFQGENFTPVKVKPSDKSLPTLPRPSQPKPNHKFLGWSKDGRNPITRDAVKPGETVTLQPLWQPVNNTTTRTEIIPVTTTYRGDDSLDYKKQNETPGTPGEKRITTTYTVTPYTGELTNPVESTEIIRTMTPRVITIGTKPTSMVENILSPKVYQADPTRPRNSEDIITQGQPGSKTTTTTYTVNPNTGQVTSKQNQPVIKQPTNTIVKVATQDTVTNTPIQPRTRYEADPLRARGEKDITTPGTPGNTRTVTTYTVNPNTGKVTETVGQPTVTKPATDTVIKIASQDKVAKSNPVTKTTRVNKDTTKLIGYRNVDVEGSDGYTETITHYNVESTTGNVTERTETRVIPPVERVITEGALAYDLPTTGTADMTITLAGLSGALIITKRKKTSK